MDSKKYTVEDFVLDKRFRKWVLKPDKENSLYWQKYLSEHPDQTGAIEEARKIILHLPRRNYRLSESEIKDMWQNIADDMGQEAGEMEKVIPINQEALIKRYSARKKIDYSHYGKYAAAVVLLITIGAAWLMMDKQPAEVTEPAQEWVTKETPWGQKSTIYLSDGSEVILNSGSQIRFLKHFTETERLVVLSGEAFFSVSKDSLRPFKVQTGNVTAQAIGTSFNIDAYQPDENVDVSLVSGKIMVSLNNKNNARMLLNPGEKATYTSHFDDLQKSVFEYAATVGWKDRLLVFRDSDQTGVFDKLAKWYGVEFVFENKSYKAWNYNGEFKNLDLDNVLGSISFAMDFQYEIRNNIVQIKFNNR